LQPSLGTNSGETSAVTDEPIDPWYSEFKKNVLLGRNSFEPWQRPTAREARAALFERFWRLETRWKQEKLARLSVDRDR
jgi:hypothetical protein